MVIGGCGDALSYKICLEQVKSFYSVMFYWDIVDIDPEIMRREDCDFHGKNRKNK